uniref:Glutaredoxin domain-containing protein n=1 Tax=Strigamia maritima TaxID=126957 RepID=T1JI96_STRMM
MVCECDCEREREGREFLSHKSNSSETYQCASAIKTKCEYHTSPISKCLSPINAHVFPEASGKDIGAITRAIEFTWLTWFQNAFKTLEPAGATTSRCGVPDYTDEGQVGYLTHATPPLNSRLRDTLVRWPEYRPSSVWDALSLGNVNPNLVTNTVKSQPLVGSIFHPNPVRTTSDQPGMTDRCKSIIEILNQHNTDFSTFDILSDEEVFMKENRETPRCGFSKNLTEILNETGVSYSAFDISLKTSNMEIMRTLKPLIFQLISMCSRVVVLFLNGELVGGLDIIKELKSSGELLDTLVETPP